MLFPRVARLAALGATLLAIALGCTSSGRHDQFYGTDVGANWIPPDATVRETVVRADGGADAGEAGVDGGVDAGTPGDAPSADAPSADAPAGDTL